MEIRSELVHSSGNYYIAFTAQCCSKTLFPLWTRARCILKDYRLVECIANQEAMERLCSIYE